MRRCCEARFASRFSLGGLGSVVFELVWRSSGFAGAVAMGGYLILRQGSVLRALAGENAHSRGSGVVRWWSGWVGGVRAGEDDVVEICRCLLAPTAIRPWLSPPRPRAMAFGIRALDGRQRGVHSPGAHSRQRPCARVLLSPRRSHTQPLPWRLVSCSHRALMMFYLVSVCGLYAGCMGGLPRLRAVWSG